ncbi:DNA-3-methyladenine glycosylase family protein [Amycolatopsis sp. CA-230715]|uniref:DNA-3-methyladenine glycosylase family protein n=1 Tax=Amycolatopsis sp. CA-230715 TaxID=2745196 RepID=UPI001C019AC0|nr:DNA-3-methyladenine glycosylase 2 family protein [Amycolatopsis sp. CA-230715]QWF78569.1 hypothetical protein HUW46_01965 [Amycolatopsis sp. CA-230715]
MHTTTVTPGIVRTEVPVDGPFDLSASVRFLEAFTPAARADAADEDGALRLAFPVEGGWRHAGALVRQRAPGTVEIEVRAPDPDAALAQVRRILSVDVPGTGFEAIGARDEVVGPLQRRYPGLRPVLFHSPYEAACWAVIGQRLRMTQAAQVKRRIAERYGEQVVVGGRSLPSFPAPRVLGELPQVLGLPAIKIRRLHAVAAAAERGELEPGALRELSVADALERLRELPGIGPFSAQLILVRGAGHPDVFPRDERRLADEMRVRYGLPEATVDELAGIAESWRPFRSWVGLLLRVDRERRTGEIGGASGK